MLKQKILNSSTKKPYFVETDDGNKFVNTISNDFLKKRSYKKYSSYNSKGAVSAGTFIGTVRDFLEKPGFEKGN